MVDKNNEYTAMQKAYYSEHAVPWEKTKDNPIVSTRDYVTGNFLECNTWPSFTKYLFKDIETKNKICLDFACGPGRNLSKYFNTFDRIDGVDINQTNLDNAKLWLKHKNKDPNKPRLYLCNGIDLDVIDDCQYDIVMSTIAFQHICVHEIRFSYLKEFFRVLKPGGWITIQMGYGPPAPDNANIHGTVPYFENNYSAGETNGLIDVRVDSPAEIKQDLDKIGYINYRYDIDEPGPAKGWCAQYGLHSQWIYFKAQKPKD